MGFQRQTIKKSVIDKDPKVYRLKEQIVIF